MSGLQKTNNITSVRADFDRSNFNILIEQKGRNVIIEKALQCACKSKSTNQQSNCKNCGGCGWFFINPRNTRLVLKGMKITQNYKAWSEEITGDLEVTATDNEELTFMDRFTITDSKAIFNEVLFFKVSGSTTFAYTSYDIKEIKYIGYFKGTSLVFQRLELGTDFTFDKNIITLINPAIVAVQGFISVTIRYVHAPVYYMIDMKRESMESFEVTDGSEKLIRLPIAGTARRGHYILTANNLAGNRLLNNSYEVSVCKTAGVCLIPSQNSNVYNFYVVQGDTFNYEIAILESGIAVDISGRTYKMQIRDSSTTLLLTLQIGSGITFVDTNKIRLFIQNVTLNVGFYFYDLQETIGSNVETIQRGNFIVDPQVTI